MSGARLLLIRHAPTEWNAAGRIQGRSDEPLSQTGREEAAGWRLPAFAADWPVYCSPLGRARETAASMGLTVQVEAALIEMAWGAWEGEILSDLRRRLGTAMAENEDKGWDFQPPEGESPRRVFDRLVPFLQRQAMRGEDAVAICHKGVIRALYAAARGWDFLGKAPGKLQSGRGQLLTVTPGPRLAVERLNLELKGQ